MSTDFVREQADLSARRPPLERDGQEHDAGTMLQAGEVRYPANLLGGSKLRGQGNGSTRVAALQQAQRAQGNRAVQRAVRQPTPIQRLGLEWLGSAESGAAHWLANKSEGVPVLGSMANAGAGFMDAVVQTSDDMGRNTAGIGSSMGSGLSKMYRDLSSDALGMVNGNPYSGLGRMYSDLSGDALGMGNSMGSGLSKMYRDLRHDESDASNAVKKGEESVNSGIDWLENAVSGGAHQLAKMTSGIPVLGSLTEAGAKFEDFGVQVPGGILKGAMGLLGGIGNMLANPIGTVEGLEPMAEHSSPIPIGILNPLKDIHQAYNVLSGHESIGTAANELFNPVQDIKERYEIGKKMVGGMLEPYKESLDEKKYGKPKYGEVVGRGIFDIGMLALGGGEAEAPAEVGNVARAANATDAAKFAKMAETTKTTEVTNAARVEEVTNAAKPTEVANTADGTRLAETGDGDRLFPDFTERPGDDGFFPDLIHESDASQASGGGRVFGVGEGGDTGNAAHNAADYQRLKAQLAAKERGERTGFPNQVPSKLKDATRLSERDLLPQRGNSGYGAPYKKQPQAAYSSNGARTTENEHMIPRGNTKALTYDPDTGLSDYGSAEYANDYTVRTSRKMALNKTHANRGGPTTDNARTKALKNAVKSGNPINYREDVFMPSIKNAKRARNATKDFSVTDEAINRGALNQDANLFNMYSSENAGYVVAGQGEAIEDFDIVEWPGPTADEAQAGQPALEEAQALEEKEELLKR